MATGKLRELYDGCAQRNPYKSGKPRLDITPKVFGRCVLGKLSAYSYTLLQKKPSSLTVFGSEMLPVEPLNPPSRPLGK